MHCTPLHFQGLMVLRSNTQSSIVSPLRPTPPFPIGKQESEPNFCIGWDRHCSRSLRLSQIYGKPRNLSQDEDAWRMPEHSVQDRKVD